MVVIEEGQREVEEDGFNLGQLGNQVNEFN